MHGAAFLCYKRANIFFFQTIVIRTYTLFNERINLIGVLHKRDYEKNIEIFKN